MLTTLWRRLNSQLALWREVALPGLLLIIIVLIIRWIGLLQVQEWMAFDTLSRSCPASMAKSSIMIIGIDEADLNAVGGFPVPDQTLVDLLTTIQGYQPAVIGLDLFRAKPVQPGHDALVKLLTQSPNLVGVEIALNAKTGLNIKPPSMLPPEQIGFVDAMADEDGKLRRMALASSVPGQSRLKYSFALQLVKRYLEMKGIPFQVHVPIHNPIQFGSFKFDLFKPNSGAYVRADAAGKQLLLNFCANQRLYPTLSLTDVLQRNFAPELIRDRIVIIGMTAPSVRDVFFISALKETLASSLMGKLLPTTQLIYGVEAQAHAVDQLVNAVLGNQPQLRVWTDVWEYLWIASWGLLGISLGILLRSPWKSLVSLMVATVTLISLSLFALMLGWWIPLVPAALALGGAGMITTFFDRDLRFELEYRRVAVERMYETVHNGPLQHLSVILRNLDGDHSSEPLHQQLQSLDEELRSIFEHMRQTMLTHSDRLYLKENLVLDLQAPLSELLYQVYNYTLEIQTPGFAEIQTYISPDFELLKRTKFNVEQKRGLCLFLQEALWNVGNHAIGATRLDVMCLRERKSYVLRVIDNGTGVASNREGQGTRQAKIIAWRLGGQFQRRSNFPQGTICELIFPIKRNKLRWIRRLK